MLGDGFWWGAGLTALIWFLWARTRRRRPPTARQEGFIEELFEERDADDLMGVQPKTVEQASALIDQLLKRPRR